MQHLCSHVLPAFWALSQQEPGVYFFSAAHRPPVRKAATVRMLRRVFIRTLYRACARRWSNLFFVISRPPRLYAGAASRRYRRFRALKRPGVSSVAGGWNRPHRRIRCCPMSPEYLHVLINPLPVYGLAMGFLALAGALLLRSRRARMLALGITCLCGASAWPVYHYGEKSYTNVMSVADGPGAEWMDEHQRRAEKAIVAFYIV